MATQDRIRKLEATLAELQRRPPTREPQPSGSSNAVLAATKRYKRSKKTTSSGQTLQPLTAQIQPVAQGAPAAATQSNQTVAGPSSKAPTQTIAKRPTAPMKPKMSIKKPKLVIDESGTEDLLASDAE